MSKEYNNPFEIAEKMKREFDIRNIEITNIKHDDHFGGSWMIDFLLNELNYRFVWDGRDSWLILVFLGKSISQKQESEDIAILRYNKAIRTSKEKVDLERFVIEKMITELDKLKQMP